MKTSLRLLSRVTLLGAALLALVPTVVSAADSGVSYPVEKAGEYVEVGTPIVAVQAKLGAPHQRIARDSWAYRGFRAVDTGSSGAVTSSANVLVITFRDNKVAKLELVAPAVVVARIDAQRQRAGSVVASASE